MKVYHGLEGLANFFSVVNGVTTACHSYVLIVVPKPSSSWKVEGSECDDSVSLDRAGSDRFEGLRDGGRPQELFGTADVSREAAPEHSRLSETVDESTAPTEDTRRRGL